VAVCDFLLFRDAGATLFEDLFEEPFLSTWLCSRSLSTKIFRCLRISHALGVRLRSLASSPPTRFPAPADDNFVLRSEQPQFPFCDWKVILLFTERSAPFRPAFALLSVPFLYFLESVRNQFLKCPAPFSPRPGASCFLFFAAKQGTNVSCYSFVID